jgi:hypothetical protein
VRKETISMFSEVIERENPKRSLKIFSKNETNDFLQN